MVINSAHETKITRRKQIVQAMKIPPQLTSPPFTLRALELRVTEFEDVHFKVFICFVLRIILPIYSIVMQYQNKTCGHNFTASNFQHNYGQCAGQLVEVCHNGFNPILGQKEDIFLEWSKKYQWMTASLTQLIFFFSTSVFIYTTTTPQNHRTSCTSMSRAQPTPTSQNKVRPPTKHNHVLV